MPKIHASDNVVGKWPHVGQNLIKIENYEHSNSMHLNKDIENIYLMFLQ